MRDNGFSVSVFLGFGIATVNCMKNIFARRIGVLLASPFLLALFFSFFVVAWTQTPAQAPSSTPAQTPDATPANPPSAANPTPGGRQRRQNQDENGPRPVFGRIVAIQDGVMKISRPDGSEATVKITSTTEFRKDREPAKLKDFKVGDGVVVRGEENPDYSFTAQMIVGRNGNGPNGPNRQNPVGTLGKDFVIGEVKALDPPSITVMRTDNVKQTFELNEDTSLRKGRESVTMADVQVGDHIFARGALQDNQFVPKTVTVIAPDQWKRMQELGVTSPAAGRATQQGNAQGGTAGSATKATPGAASGAAPSKPTEPPN
jgi:hypothetical protein